jgi:integrase
MGRIVLRGTRDLPKVYADYYDSDGTRRTRLLQGARTKLEGRKLLADILARVAAGTPGLDSKEALVASAVPAVVVVGLLMRDWLESLENRNAKLDRQRAEKHVLPAWEHLNMEAAQQLPLVMRWLDTMRRAKNLSPQSMRHNLNLLSRFFAWAIERGYATINPVRQIPSGKRPQGAPKTDGPWIRDEETFRKLYEALPVPVRYVFWLGNRSGLRPDEARGLRISDMAWLGQGTVRVRFSGSGPLKEDRRGLGKVKWVPAAGDAPAVLGPWLERRKAEGAASEDLLFIPVVASDRPRRLKWRGLRKEFVQSCWEEARLACGVSMTFYEATRHSFISRNLEAGVPLDEVSAAVGHSSPVVTKRHYDRFIRRSFSDAIRGIAPGAAALSTGPGEDVVAPEPQSTAEADNRNAATVHRLA